MQRKELLDKLTTVEPALSSNNLIPIMADFWFTGTDVMAFNDQIAISVPCKTSFKGAVKGSAIINLLKNSKAKDFEITSDNNELILKAKTLKIKLGLSPAEDFLFEIPKVSDKAAIPVKMNDFLSGIENCMRSVGVDTSMPDQLGITVIPEKGSLALYSTDNKTMSYSLVPTKGKLPLSNRVILSSTFCSQVLRLGKLSKKSKLIIDEDHALFITDKNVTLFGRLIESDKPMDFAETLEHHFPKKARAQLSPIPSKLKLIIERAMVIASLSIDERATKVIVKEGKMRFLSKSSYGEISDSMQISDKQPEVSSKVDPKLLKNGYGSFKEMLITKNCVIMANENSLYMIAAVGGE